jgi:putative spermidine/putrescine transport system permease protein
MRRVGPPRAARRARAVLVGLILLYLVAPALIVIPLSFTGESMRRFPIAAFSLAAYTRFFEQPGWVPTTLFSLSMATCVMILAVLIGTATAYGIIQSPPRFKRIVSVLVLVPIIAPTIIFALGIFWLLAQFRLLGTFTGFVCANLVLALPYAIVVIRGGLERFDQSLLKAAAVLGARPARAVLFVAMPLLLPAIAAGGLFAFLIAFDEVVVAQFISGPHAVPLSKQMWDGILYRWDPAISAISTMQIAMTIAVLVLLALLRRKRVESSASTNEPGLS